MATVTRLWGKSEVEFRGLIRDRDRIMYEYGVNSIRPGALIDLHHHNGYEEDYVPLTGGLKIIVLPEKEAKAIYTRELIEILKKTEYAKVGEVVTCPEGYWHALYCDVPDDCIGKFRYIKYCNV